MASHSFIDDIIMTCAIEELMDHVEKKIGDFVEIKPFGDLPVLLGRCNETRQRWNVLCQSKAILHKNNTDWKTPLHKLEFSMVGKL